MLIALSLISLLGLVLIVIEYNKSPVTIKEYAVTWEFSGKEDLVLEDVLDFVRVEYEGVYFLSEEAARVGIVKVEQGNGIVTLKTVTVRGNETRSAIVDYTCSRFPSGNLALFRVSGTVVLHNQ